MTDYQVVGAECAVAVVVASWGVYPLTPCCQASAKGSIAGDYPATVCRNCYEEVDDSFGDCWQPTEERGWRGYRRLLLLVGLDDDKVDETVAYVRGKVAALEGVN